MVFRMFRCGCGDRVLDTGIGMDFDAMGDSSGSIGILMEWRLTGMHGS